MGAVVVPAFAEFTSFEVLYDEADLNGVIILVGVLPRNDIDHKRAGVAYRCFFADADVVNGIEGLASSDALKVERVFSHRDVRRKNLHGGCSRGSIGMSSVLDGECELSGLAGIQTPVAVALYFSNLEIA